MSRFLASETNRCREFKYTFLFSGNLYWPTWIILSHIIYGIINVSEYFSSILLSLYDNFFYFTKLNSNLPFSANNAKSYFGAVFLLMPIQFYILYISGKQVVQRMASTNEKFNQKILAILYCVISTALVFDYSPGTHGLPGTFGGGHLTVSIVTAVVTGSVPLSLAIAYFAFLNDKTET